MKNKKLKLISVVTIIIISSSVLLGVLLQRLPNNILNNDYKLTIFTEEEDIISLNTTDFFEIAEKKLSIPLIELLSRVNITSFEQLKIISQQDNGYIFENTYLTNSLIKLTKIGFQITVQALKIVSVKGIAIDFEYFTVDIAPTIYSIFKIEDWLANGQIIPLPEKIFNKTIVILLDGFGWNFWSNLTTLKEIELIIEPFFVQPALTVYPSITNVATASLLTGFWPKSTGILSRNNHQINVLTIFDILSSKGILTEFIEGNVGFLNLNADYESWLPDVNGNNSSDDEIFLETIKSLNESRSEFLFIHFHGIDDFGHSFGPNSLLWLNKVKETFDYVNTILTKMNNNTLVVITADHGMHLSLDSSDNRTGSHGDCCWEDMVVPLVFITK